MYRALYSTSLLAHIVKNLPGMQKTRVWSLGWEDLLEKEMATHSSILAWRVLWTEEPGRLHKESDTIENITMKTLLCVFLGNCSNFFVGKILINRFARLNNLYALQVLKQSLSTCPLKRPPTVHVSSLILSIIKLLNLSSFLIHLIGENFR